MEPEIYFRNLIYISVTITRSAFQIPKDIYWCKFVLNVFLKLILSSVNNSMKMLLLKVMVAFCGRNLRGDLKINSPRFKSIHIRSRLFSKTHFRYLIQNHREIMSVNIQCPNGYFVCVCVSYIIFSRVRHEQERSRNYSMLSIPTQLRIVPENSVISMGTYYGRRGCFLVFVLSQERYWGFPGGAVVENLPANAGDTGSSPGLGRSHMPRSN